MKKKNLISKVVVAGAFVAVSSFPSFGQQDLGKGCGCPAVSARAAKNFSALDGFVMDAGSTTTGTLTKGATLNCGTTYLLDVKAHVPAGQSIKIPAGTLIKGKSTGATPVPANEAALIIDRGGMIDACGTVDCPIVFTAENDPMNNTYSLDNKGQWGGIVILGKATNNLTLAANGPAAAGKLAIKNGLGTIEGFNKPTDARYNFGADIDGGEAFNDNDNSGTMRYVSIRFAGANLEVGNEINGLTLGSVGNGTTIEHVEVVSCADDAFEFFGGTVNVRYLSSIFGNDDMFDWDLGYSGKAQFLFGLKAPNNQFSADSDNGFEMDSDDNKSNNAPASHPIIYNATFIGNGKSVQNSDNSALAGINAKELTEGEIYNSIFANWFIGFNVVKTFAAPRTKEAYDNWTSTGSQKLKIKCNAFVGSGSDFTIDKTLVPAGADRTQFLTTDKNTTTALGSFDPTFTVTLPSTISNGVDATPTPNTLAAGCASPTLDGFFTTASYKGAFSPIGKSWLSTYSYSSILKSTEGLQNCPTDVTGDGATTGADLSQILLQIGKSCQ